MSLSPWTTTRDPSRCGRLRVTLEFRGFTPVTPYLDGEESVCEVPPPASEAGTVLARPDGESGLELDRRNRELLGSGAAK